MRLLFIIALLSVSSFAFAGKCEIKNKKGQSVHTEKTRSPVDCKAITKRIYNKYEHKMFGAARAYFNGKFINQHNGRNCHVYLQNGKKRASSYQKVVRACLQYAKGVFKKILREGYKNAVVKFNREMVARLPHGKNNSRGSGMPSAVNERLKNNLLPEATRMK